jgi:hypothetical protein
MLIKLLKAELNKIHIRRWILLYFITFVIAAIVAIIFFKDSSYSPDQIAAVIAIPIIISITFVRLYQYFMSRPEGRKAPERVHEGQSVKGVEAVLLTVSVIFLLFMLASLAFAIVMAISSWLYMVLGLQWANGITWHNLAVNSFCASGISLSCLAVAIVIFIVRPYWLKIFRTVRERLRVWGESTKDIRINGYKIPLHR